MRQDLHAHSESGFEEIRTSTLVAKRLAEWDIEAGLSKSRLEQALTRSSGQGDPNAIRSMQAAGFRPGTELEFVLDDSGDVRVRRQADPPENLALKAAIGQLRGRATAKMTTDEIIALTRG